MAVFWANATRTLGWSIDNPGIEFFDGLERGEWIATSTIASDWIFSGSRIVVETTPDSESTRMILATGQFFGVQFAFRVIDNPVVSRSTALGLGKAGARGWLILTVTLKRDGQRQIGEGSAIRQLGWPQSSNRKCRIAYYEPLTSGPRNVTPPIDRGRRRPARCQRSAVHILAKPGATRSLRPLSYATSGIVP